MNTANTRQVGGQHYIGEYQHWDFATDVGMCHLEGAASKYLARFGNKSGTSAEMDLEKTVHYLEKLIEMHTEGRIVSIAKRRLCAPPAQLAEDIRAAVAESLAKFMANIKGYAAKPRTMAALVLLTYWTDVGQLSRALTLVNEELEYERSLPKAPPRSEA